MAGVNLETVTIQKPDDVNIVIGQAHFIKTVEDLYEAVVTAVPSAQFGIAFCEASGKALIRIEGNSNELKRLAEKNAVALACGHMFIIVLRDAFPINILNRVKEVSEVCRIFCATANPVEVIVAVSGQGRGVLGVIDGVASAGVEQAEDVAWRKELLRKIGYKR